MWIFLLLVTLGIWCYAVARGIWQLPSPKPWRLGIAFALLPIAGYQLILRLLNPPPGYPEQPRLLLILLAFGFGSLLLLALLALLRDLLLVITRPFSTKTAALLIHARVAMALVLLAIGLSATGVHNALAVPAVKEVTITLPKLPAAFDGYRLVQLSDLHISRLFQRDWLDAVVARTNALKPDLIAITGDLQDAIPDHVRDDIAPLARLKAADGVVMVPGNHEYYFNYALWMQTFRALGLTTLENQHLTLTRQGATLTLAGLTDPQAERFHLPLPNLQLALKDAPAETPVLLLTHQSKNAREYAKAGVMLQLAGHTHGGQIEGIHLLTQWANRGFVSGLYQVDGMSLYVSNGTALWAGLPLRLLRPAEITLVVLKAEPH